MYSMVLMMAVSASPEAAAFGKSYSCLGCTGCNGCTGVVVSGCSGCSGCHGFSLFGCKGCSGCHGFSLFGCKGSSCHGSCTGCTGCTGCHGSIKVFSCHGSCTGCTGCSGCHGIFGGWFKSKGCHGCTGCTGCTGCIGTVVTPVEAAPVEVKPEAKPLPKEEKKAAPTVSSLPATITLNVPADAKVTIDGLPTSSTSNTRVFATPALKAGTVYYYTIAAEVVRDGKTLTASDKVAVEAGANATLTLSPNVGAAVVSK